MVLEIDSLRTREGHGGRASEREREKEGAGVKERKYEERERTGELFCFLKLIQALVSPRTCFGTLGD